MLLKRLEIQGFKSFPDRTVFKFQEDGLTVVVGPNGCGKSNIVDAVRWTLGEQSAKLLRGQTMEDVIFNGSDRRKPAGMAEVTLVFDNDGSLDNQWRDYAELSVSRKLFRTGESEYLINGVSCRLKDIRELLADAGGSSRGYSIVEQGKISLLINSRPEEKRALIEEAAGVLKYRMRRLEAERKIERTRQNLLRVSDVIREVRRQLNSMKRSAARARRYRILRDELTALDLRFRFEDYSAFVVELERVESELQGRRSVLGDLEAGMSAAESREEVLRAGLLEGEGRVTEGFEAVRATEAGIARLESDISVRESAIRSLEERLVRLEEDEADLSARTESERNELQQLELELAAIEDEHGRFNTLLEEAQERFNASESALRQVRSDVESSRISLFTIGTEKSRLEMEADSGRKAREALGRRREDSSHRISDVRSRIEAHRKECQERESEFQGAVESARVTADRLDSLREAIQAGRSSVDEAESRLAVLSERQAEIRGLQRTLVALEEQMEGLPEGARHVMRHYTDAGQSGVLGVVADYIDVPQPYEKAVTAVLGERLGHMIVNAPEDARAVIGHLKERTGGRGSFIPKSPRANGKGNGIGAVRGDGIHGPLVDMVNFSASLNGVGDFLLGDALLVEDLNIALDLWRRNGFTATIVTLDGDVVESTGVITGGSQTDGETLLARKRKIRELGTEAGQVEYELNRTRETRDDLKVKIAADEARLLQAEEEGRTAERARLANESALTMARRELQQAQGILEDLDSEMKLIDREDSEAALNIERCLARLEELTAEEITANERTADLAKKVTDLGVQMVERRSALEEARIKVSSLGLRRESSQRALETAASRNQEVQERKERLNSEREETRSRIGMHHDHVAGGRETVRKEILVLEEKKAELDRLRALQDESRLAAEELSVAARNLRSKAASVREEISRLDIRSSEVRSELAHIRDRVREEHKSDVSSIAREQFEAGEFDRVQAGERIATLREKISQMGEVNPGAVEEFEELNERYEFLTAQQQDLELSIESLVKAIRKINRTSRERFLATFREVSDNFGRLFPRLITGGSAQMIILDETDPLNSGVDIQVQLPGKRLKSMQLLSGGEKALVSLTMIFAMFLARPSPICILDEVDAPLDDQNLSNFAAIIRELSGKFQFLVITHNKLTMEAADVLYGITMREPGASQVVSVRLRDVA
ncbi:MAG: chromosome segregation protein SMC [bacterium]|nr:chromosome segregation protein SMC [bacterium]